MQDEYRNLDQFFAESLKGFREKPPVDAWQRLEEDLLAARRHRRVVLYRWTAAAAVLLIALVAGYFLMDLNKDHQLKEKTFSQLETPIKNQPVQATIPVKDITTDKTTEPTTTVASTPSEMSSGTSERTASHSEIPSFPVQSDEKEVTATLLPNEIQEEIVSAETAENEFAEPAAVVPEMPAAVNPEQKNILTPPLPDLAFQEQPEQEEAGSRWSIGGSFAPVYAYRNIQINAEELPPDVNPDINYYNSSEEPVYSYSGGVDIAVYMSDKWQFQTGLYLSSLGQSNEEVIAFEVEGVKDLMKVSSSTGMIRIVTSSLPEEFVDNSVRRDSITDAVYISSNIRQSFTYLELPLLVRYSLLDKRFGLNLTGGFSPGIMTEYKAQFTYEGEHIDLNNESDFYNMILNSHVGLGIHYRITGSLSISLDPAFKYSLNSIRKDHSIQYHPYSVSVFTGVRYSF